MTEVLLDATVWRYTAASGGWYFVSFTKKDVASLGISARNKGGWGHIPVIVRIGNSQWKTSLFPSRERGYDLPIKASIRKKEDIADGTRLSVYIKKA